MELPVRLCTCLYHNAMLYWKLGNRIFMFVPCINSIKALFIIPQ
jgi:hypothetical protein